MADLFARLGGRRGAAGPSDEGEASPAGRVEPVYPTKALQKFLAALASREAPLLVDLGPAVGSNVTFFGERLGCRFRVEDVFSDIEGHVRARKQEELPACLAARFAQEPASVDGILCWDVLDYLDRPAAQALAGALTRLLKPEGVLLGFFNAAEPARAVYTKYVVVDETSLRYRTYPASAPRQRTLLNRDILKLFEGLRVTESYLMKTHVREILLKKPAYLASS